MKTGSFTKRGLVIAAIAAATLLSGCGGEAAETVGAATSPADLVTTDANRFEHVETVEDAASLLPDEVRSRGSMSVAMNLSTPPTKFLAEDGSTPLGTNPDLARLLGRILGVKVDIKNVEFDGIIPGLQSGQFDLSVASMGVTDERLEVLDMIDYAQWGSMAVVEKGSDVTTDALCGLAVGVQQGSLQQAEVLPGLSSDCVDRGDEPIKIVSLPSQQDALTQLNSGRLDAAFGDTPNMAYAVQLQGDMFQLGGDEIHPLPVTLSTDKGSALTPALLAAMQYAVTLPEYRKIFDVWGLPDAAVDKVEVR